LTGPRVAGVDPGTVSFDLCALTGGEVVLERSFPTADVRARRMAGPSLPRAWGGSVLFAHVA